MSFGNAISYILSNISKVFSVFSGLSYLKTGGVQKSLNVVKANGTHFDMRNAQDAIYSGWSIIFWLSAFSSVLNFILTTIFDGFAIGGLIWSLVFLAIPLCVIALVITFGKKNETHWIGWLVKVFVICCMVGTVGFVLSAVWSVLSTILGLIGTVIGATAIGGFLGGGIGLGAGVKVAIELILSCVVSVVITLMQAITMLTILGGLNNAVPVNGGQMNPNGYNPNGYNPNGYNPNGYNPNGYNPNDYNSNMTNSAGLAGLGAVNAPNNNQNSFNLDKNNNQNNFNQNQNNFNQNNFNQNNFNQNQNNFGQNKQNTNPQNVQMYACPYCGKAVVHGANPCPHCNNSLNWG